MLWVDFHWQMEACTGNNLGISWTDYTTNYILWTYVIQRVWRIDETEADRDKHANAEIYLYTLYIHTCGYMYMLFIYLVLYTIICLYAISYITCPLHNRYIDNSITLIICSCYRQYDIGQKFLFTALSFVHMRILAKRKYLVSGRILFFARLAIFGQGDFKCIYTHYGYAVQTEKDCELILSWSWLTLPAVDGQLVSCIVTASYTLEMYISRNYQR